MKNLSLTFAYLLQYSHPLPAFLHVQFFFFMVGLQQSNVPFAVVLRPVADARLAKRGHRAHQYPAAFQQCDMLQPQ